MFSGLEGIGISVLRGYFGLYCGLYKDTNHIFTYVGKLKVPLKGYTGEGHTIN